MNHDKNLCDVSGGTVTSHFLEIIEIYIKKYDNLISYILSIF